MDGVLYLEFDHVDVDVHRDVAFGRLVLCLLEFYGCLTMIITIP